MAQWQRLAELSERNDGVAQRANIIYERYQFPSEVRSSQAGFIEQQNWFEMNVGRDEDLDKAETLLDQLELLVMQQRSTNFILKKRVQDFFGIYKNDVAQFIRTMQEILREENTLIDSCREDDNALHHGEVIAEMARENPQLRQKVTEMSEKMAIGRRNKQDFQTFQDQSLTEFDDLQAQWQQLNSDIENPNNRAIVNDLHNSKSRCEQNLLQKASSIRDKQQQICTMYVQQAIALTTVLKGIWKEIDCWEKEKKLAITKKTRPKEGIINVLEGLAHDGTMMLLQMIGEVNEVKNLLYTSKWREDVDLEQQNKINIMLKELEEDYLKEHMKHIFVVDNNPPQVIKVGAGRSANFKMGVRLLGGSPFGVQPGASNVTAKLFHERDLKAALEDPANKEGYFNMMNCSGRPLETQQQTSHVVCIFSHVRLQQASKRPLDRNNEELVTDQKYGIIFYTHIQIGKTLHLLKTLSLPIILTSQTSQECMAKGTLIWDAAFSQLNRLPFVETERVQWRDICLVLQTLFRDYTSRDLDQAMLHYLGKLAFRDQSVRDFTNQHINKTKLIREKLCERPFSFWQWFFSCMNLLKDVVNKEWKDNLIYGFVGKDDCRRMLRDKPSGTFLLRFSESDIEQSQRAENCGCLTLAVLETCPETRRPKVYFVKEHLDPKEIRDKNGLAFILKAYQVEDHEKPKGVYKPLLTFLWPDKPLQPILKPYLVSKPRGGAGSGYYRNVEMKINIDLSSSGNAAPRNVRQTSFSDSVGPTSPAMSAMSLSSPPDSGQVFSPQAVDLSPVHSPQVARVVPLQANHQDVLSLVQPASQGDFDHSGMMNPQPGVVEDPLDMIQIADLDINPEEMNFIEQNQHLMYGEGGGMGQ